MSRSIIGVATRWSRARPGGPRGGRHRHGGRGRAERRRRRGSGLRSPRSIRRPSPGPRWLRPWSPGGARRWTSTSRRRRAPRPTGTVIGRIGRPTRCRRRLRAQGGQPGPGQYVEFTCGRGQRDHRAVQHSGRAQRRRDHRPLDVTVNGSAKKSITLTSSTPGCTTCTRSPTTPVPVCCTRTGGSPSVVRTAGPDPPFA